MTLRVAKMAGTAKAGCESLVEYGSGNRGRTPRNCGR